MNDKRLSTDELMNFLMMSIKLDPGSMAINAIFSRLCAADNLYEAAKRVADIAFVGGPRKRPEWAENIHKAIANYEKPEWKTVPLDLYSHVPVLNPSFDSYR